MRQIRLEEGKLLDQNGNLIQAGYSTSLVKEYRRGAIKAPKIRIKEWDYYYVGNSKFGVALTIADNSYMGLVTVSVMDFEAGTFINKSAISLFPMGKTNMPQTSKIGNVSVRNRNLDIRFLNDGKKRQLVCKMKNFDKGQDFSCDLLLFNEPSESMVIATPFEKQRYFYYNQKINCLKATGKATVGTKFYNFDKELSFGVFDWGRGVWPYSSTWYWSSASGLLKDGRTIGFNLGYGFGDTSHATENMIFLNGKAYKTEQITFHIPKNEKGKFDYMSEWTFTSSDKKVNLVFTPVLDRASNSNVLIIQSDQHQVFGKFNGTVVCDEEVIEIKDLMGFAERVVNRY